MTQTLLLGGVQGWSWSDGCSPGGRVSHPLIGRLVVCSSPSAFKEACCIKLWGKHYIRTSPFPFRFPYDLNWLLCVWRSSSSTLVPQTTELLTLPLWERADTLQKKLILLAFSTKASLQMYRDQKCPGTGHTAASLPHVMLRECWSSSQLVVKSPLWHSSLWSSPSWWRRQPWLTEQPQPQPPHTVCYFNSASMENIKWKNNPIYWTIFFTEVFAFATGWCPQIICIFKNH